MRPVRVSDEVALQDAEWQIAGSRSKVTEKEQVEACLVLIDKYLKTKLKGVQLRGTSYGLKHLFERVAGIYILNGSAIKAMVLSGFTPYQGEGGLCGSTKEKPMHNYYFNYSLKEWRELEEESQKAWRKR
jgi:hypothetical protein